MEFTTTFCTKVSQVGYISPLIRSHSCLDHRYLGVSAFISWFLTQGSISRTPLKSVFLLFCLLTKKLMQTIGQTWLNLVALTCGSWSEGRHDLYFTVQWFSLIIFPYILKTIRCMYIILWDNESVWSEVWPQNKCRSLLIFHGPVILLCTLKAIWYMNVIIRDYELVWLDVWSKNKCRSRLPIFQGSVILRNTLKPIFLWTSYFGIMGQYDQTFDLKINVFHCDQYFMSSDFPLCLKDYLMDEFHIFR